MSIPVICNLLTFSLRMVAPIKVTHIGLVVTRKVLLEIEMYSKDIIHARKWIAKKPPASAVVNVVFKLGLYLRLKTGLIENSPTHRNASASLKSPIVLVDTPSYWAPLVSRAAVPIIKTAAVSGK